MCGPLSVQGRDQFLNELGDLFGFCGSKWCLVGDFNMTRSQVERAPLGRETRSTRRFNDFIEGGSWIDPRLLNSKFTWGNCRARSRIDRFLLSVDWIKILGEVRQVLGQRVTLDPWPIFLTSGCQKWGPSPFCFDNRWLTIDAPTPFFQGPDF